MGRVRLGWVVGCAGVVLACSAADAAARTLTPVRVGYRSQVFVVKRSGGVHRLTGGTTSHYRPTWSRRGLRVAVSTVQTLEILSLDGRVRHTIRGGTASSGQVAWSPDDRRIAFVSYHRRRGHPGQYEGNLVVADLDGRHRRIVATHADGQPAWSADGATLYYKRGGAFESGPGDLWAVSSRGGGQRRLVSDLARDSRVLVSPTGAWILFARERDRDDDGLWIVPTNGGAPRLLLARSFLQARAYGWTDGGRAVYGTKRHRTHPVVTTLAGERRALGASFYSPQYDLSGGGWLVWFRQAGAALLAARKDGSGERTIARFTANNGIDLETLAWSPDGRRVVVQVSRHSGD